MSTQQLIDQALEHLDGVCPYYPGDRAELDAARSKLRKLAAELERLERKPQWLPIESAPKDGTSVFAFWPPSGLFPVHGGCYGVTRFCGGHWCNPEDEDDQYIWPSHWMPLPAAPDIGEGEGK